MKKHFKPFEFKINNEQMLQEQQEFNNQPQEVLEQLKIVKLLMVVFIPLTMALCYLIDFKISLIASVFVGIVVFLVMFFTLKKNIKLSLIPLICIGVGNILVLMFLSFLRSRA